MKTLLTATAIGAMLAAGVAIAMQGETPAAPKQPITKAEMLARADARFDRMDANKDGQLDANERKAGAEAARAAMADRKGGEMADFMPGAGRRGGGMGERMLGRIDTNGDGLISKAENRAATEARFARMDANGDGTIGADERGKGMGKWKRGGRRGGAAGGGPAPLDARKGQGMKADANGDGVITRAEFDAQSAARFAAMDANKDGKIDQSEMPKPRRMRGAMPPPSPQAPEGE